MKKFTPVKPAGFTLVELLVSTAVIALLMVVMLSITNQTSQTWRYTTEKVEKFQSARDGFEAMTRRLSQATLNTYWDYVDKNGKVRTQFLDQFPNDNSALSKFVPDSYGRMSELRFTSGPMSTPISDFTSATGTPPLKKLLDPTMVSDYQKYVSHGVFFQAPLGVVTDDAAMANVYGNDYGSMDNLLNTWGYFVETSDYDERPSFVTDAMTPKRWRSRLMELRLPSEKMGLYDAYTSDRTNNWFQSWLSIPNGATRPTRVLAENVTALIVWPKLSKLDEDARVALTPLPSGAQSVLCPNYAFSSCPAMDTSVNPQRPYTRCPGVVWNTVLTDDVPEKGGVNPINQLPPVVQVTMIAIDERSAKRVAELGKYSATSGDSLKYSMGFDLSKRFIQATKWNKQAPYDKTIGTPFDRTKYESYMDQDIDEYCKELAAKGVTYRVFSTNVSIRGAKWSRSQL